MPITLAANITTHAVMPEPQEHINCLSIESCFSNNARISSGDLKRYPDNKSRKGILTELGIWPLRSPA